MTGNERASQLRVGIFMALGLLAIGLMVVYFGRFGESFHGYYKIRVEYPNASGIYKGASVLLAGAKIGSVEADPVILPDMDGVYVNLKIYEEVKIPSAAQFTIGSSGLLGDRFIQIVLGKEAKSSPPIQPDGTVRILVAENPHRFQFHCRSLPLPRTIPRAAKKCRRDRRAA